MPITKKDLIEFGFDEKDANKLLVMIRDNSEPVDNVLNYAHSVMQWWIPTGENKYVEKFTPTGISIGKYPVRHRYSSYGIETIRDECYWVDHYWQDTVLLYINTGDTYAPTLYYDVIKDIFGLGSWGDWWEWHETHRNRSCRRGPRRTVGTH